MFSHTYIGLKGTKRMKLMVFTLNFWLKRSPRKNNKTDDKYNNANTR